MKKIILLLLLSFIVACGGGSKDTPDSNQNGNENDQENIEQKELYTITLKVEEGLENLSHDVTFVTQGKKFEFDDITSNNFCVVLKKSQFKTLSIRFGSSHWTYVPVSDFYCDNNASIKRGNVPGRGNFGPPTEKGECKIPTANLFLEVNETFYGFEHNLVKAEKRNTNIDKCNKLY